MRPNPSISPGAAKVTRYGWVVPCLLLLIGLAHLTCGAWLLWQQQHSSMVVKFRSSSGVLLVLLGLVQLRIAFTAWQRRGELGLPDRLRWRLASRWFLVGVVVCYAGVLLGAVGKSAPYLFWVAMAAWTTAAQLPLVARPRLLTAVLGMLGYRPLRVVGWTVYVLLVGPLAAELVLRVYALGSGSPIAATYITEQAKLVPGTSLGGRQVNAAGYWDDEFRPEVPPGVLRIAAVGDELTLGGDAETNFLVQIERRVPGVEIYNFGLPEAGPREYAAQVAHDVANYDPHLVLTFVSVGNDITQEIPLPEMFDCRWLHVVQLGTIWLGEHEHTLASQAMMLRSPHDRQTYLSKTAGQLVVCHTPIEAPMRARWHDALTHLDAVVAHCQELNVPLAIVLAPGEFQVNRPLLEMLRRRAGYRSDEVDVDLPQRRLAAYAKERRVAFLDLLPHLRACERPPFERNCRRLSSQGNAVTAAVVGHWIESQLAGILATTAQVRR